ncbi:MAG: hypothetical protein KDK78_10865, partial [Chlamydiia bacterium]|nr:hypothetical protein [Chlamydiia bacterium]
SVLGSRKASDSFDDPATKRHRGTIGSPNVDPIDCLLEEVAGKEALRPYWLPSSQDLAELIRTALKDFVEQEREWANTSTIGWLGQQVLEKNGFDQLADHVLQTGLPELFLSENSRVRFLRRDTLQMMSYELSQLDEMGGLPLSSFRLTLLPKREFSKLGEGTFKSARKVLHIDFQLQGDRYQTQIVEAVEERVGWHDKGLSSEEQRERIQRVHRGIDRFEELVCRLDSDARTHLIQFYGHWHPRPEKCIFYAPLGIGDLEQQAAKVSTAQLLQIGVDLARTLVQVHAADLCIADIKADNILLFGDGDGLRASFFDFDLLREIGADFDLNPARWEEYKFVQFGRTTHSTEKAGAYTDVVALIKAIMGVFNRFDRDFDLSVYLRLWTPRGVHPKGFEFLTKTTLKQRWLYSLVRASQAKATQGLIEGLAKLSAPSSAYKRITENPGKFVVADAGSKEDAVDRLALGMKLWQVFNNVLLADWHKSRGTYYSNGDHLTAGYLLDEFTNLQSELQKAKK